MKRFIFFLLFLSGNVLYSQTKYYPVVKVTFMNTEHQLVDFRTDKFGKTSVKTIIVDSVKITTAKTEYTFKGINDENEDEKMYHLYIRKPWGLYTLYLKNTDTIEVIFDGASKEKGVLKYLDKSLIIKGSNCTNEYYQLMCDTYTARIINSKAMKSVDSLTKINASQIKIDSCKKIINQTDLILYEIYKKKLQNTNNAVIANLILNFLNSVPQWNASDPLVDTIINRFATSKYLALQLNALKYKREFEKNIIAPGKPIINFTLNDNKNQQYSINKFNGSYIFIDFWASWCGPCRKAMPEIKEVYNKFKNKNFKIITVSLDKDKEKWLKALSHLPLNDYTNLLDADGKVANLYHIAYVPFNYLVAPDGKVIAVNISPSGLDEKLNELFR